MTILDATPVVLIAAWGFWVGGSAASFAGVVHTRGLRAAAHGRSECACGQPVPARHLLPVISWLWLRGRAACCGTPLPGRWVVGELAGALCGALGAVLAGLAGAAAGGLGGGLVAYGIYRAGERSNP